MSLDLCSSKMLQRHFITSQLAVSRTEVGLKSPEPRDKFVRHWLWQEVLLSLPV